MPKNSDQLSMLTQENYQESTSSLSDSLAKICQSLEKEKDLKAHEAVYSLKQCESLRLKNPNILSLKMSRGYSPVTKEKTLKSYYEQSPTLGTMVNGNFLILGGFSPKIDLDVTLSDILEEEVDQKYFLSEKQVKSLTTGMQKSQVLSNIQDTQVETIKE